MFSLDFLFFCNNTSWRKFVLALYVKACIAPPYLPLVLSLTIFCFSIGLMMEVVVPQLMHNFVGKKRARR